MRRRALRLHRDRIVDQILCESGRDDVVRDRRRVGPDALQLLLRVRDVVGARLRRSWSRRQERSAVLGLHAGPGTATDWRRTIDVVLQRLAREERAVVVGRREAAGPLGPSRRDRRPASSRRRSRRCRLAAVVDEVAGDRVDGAAGSWPGAQKKCFGFVGPPAAGELPAPPNAAMTAAANAMSASARADRIVCTSSRVGDASFVTGCRPAGKPNGLTGQSTAKRLLIRAGLTPGLPVCEPRSVKPSPSASICLRPRTRR